MNIIFITKWILCYQNLIHTHTQMWMWEIGHVRIFSAIFSSLFILIIPFALYRNFIFFSFHCWIVILLLFHAKSFMQIFIIVIFIRVVSAFFHLILLFCSVFIFFLKFICLLFFSASVINMYNVHIYTYAYTTLRTHWAYYYICLIYWKGVKEQQQRKSTKTPFFCRLTERIK